MTLSWPDITFGPINLWSLSSTSAPTSKIINTMSDTLHYEKLIYQNDDKFYQLKLTVSEFKDKYYLNVRKYFQSYEGDFIPSKEGVSMEASINNIASLLEGLLEIVAQEEGKVVLRDLYNKHCIEAEKQA